MAKRTFHKGERLKSRKDISHLFDEGQVVKAFPIKLIYNIVNDEDHDAALQAGVTVPIRNFRKAVARNRIKRLMREAYRIHKGDLHDYCTENKIHLQIMMIYVAREIFDFGKIEKALIKGLHQLNLTLKSE